MAIYKVKEDGKAPSGLKAGDQVVTAGGTYTIDGVNSDGTYRSSLSNKAQTTETYTGGSAAPGSAYKPTAPASQSGGNGIVDGNGNGTNASPYGNTDYHQMAIDAAKKYQYGGDWQDVLDALSARDEKISAIGTNAGRETADIRAELESLYKYPTDYRDTIADLQATVAQLQKQQPSYDGGYRDELTERLAQAAIDFNYDDWTQGEQYGSLADRYGHQGMMAMQDILGQIASRTGGLASSYAATAAQQQYNDYMAQLEEVARGQFARERDSLFENAQLALDMGDREYQRYLNELNAQQQGQSASLNALFELLGMQREQDNILYDREQTARSEAQNRIYDYLVNQGGSIGDLDPALITRSGYTTAELNAMMAQYQQAAAERGPGGGGSPGYDEVSRIAFGYYHDPEIDDMTVVDYLDRAVGQGLINEEEMQKIVNSMGKLNV